MFSTTSRKSEIVPLNANPVRRLMLGVAARAVLDLLKRDTTSVHRYTAYTFLAENRELLESAGIPARKINLLLLKNGPDAATSDPAGASR